MTFLKTGSIVKTGLILAALAVMAAPAGAFAATYAYVNASGDVSTVTANDPTSAIMTAPNIAVHSGVMLLTNPADTVVGDKVPGA
jgi:hypothetical protein